MPAVEVTPDYDGLVKGWLKPHQPLALAIAEKASLDAAAEGIAIADGQNRADAMMMEVFPSPNAEQAQLPTVIEPVSNAGHGKFPTEMLNAEVAQPLSIVPVSNAEHGQFPTEMLNAEVAQLPTNIVAMPSTEYAQLP